MGKTYRNTEDKKNLIEKDKDKRSKRKNKRNEQSQQSR